jgi:hypothetical protein
MSQEGAIARGQGFAFWLRGDFDDGKYCLLCRIQIGAQLLNLGHLADETAVLKATTLRHLG